MTKIKNNNVTRAAIHPLIMAALMVFATPASSDEAGLKDIYLMRLEQFYPFPALSLTRELARFKNADVAWCQEEPKNQGGWSFVEPNIEWVLTRIKAKHTRPVYAGRSAAASPATGLASQHKAQQAALVDDALTIKGTK